MANYSVNAEQLTEGALVLVRGKLGFARLTRLIEGAELQASDARRAQNGMNPIGVPHTTATITAAEVIYKDPTNPTLEERFVAERRYTSKKRPETGANYSIDSKGRNLPVIAIPNGDGQVIQDTSGQELTQGLDVTLALRVYKPKTYNKRGLSLDQVIVNEEVKYYGGSTSTSTSTSELAARGIIFAAPPQAVQAGQNAPIGEAAPIDTTNVADIGSGTVIDENGFAFPSPAVTPAQTTQPVQVRAQPVATAAPVTIQSVAQAPVQPAETTEEQIARLMSENATLKDAGSAIGVPVPGNPWANDSHDAQPAGITYRA
ncbi:hypothetical protein [Psychromicrobium sp. YIM B11713]|uniref:hypothetical protein n=1 Tax=Psychromicrobium sp. YIM B11713 TaxID=3145233 RepID=UPI00374E307E